MVRARAEFETARDKGLIEGEVMLAMMAYGGLGQEPDYALARQMLEDVLTVAPESERAALTPGLMLLHGHGGEADTTRALALAEEGWAPAPDAALSIAILGYGSPEYASDATDPERALAFCIAGNDAGLFELYPPSFELITLCDDLVSEASGEELARAEGVARDLIAQLTP